MFTGRSEWTSTGFIRGTALNKNAVNGITLHYPAVGNRNLRGESKSQIARRLEGWRAMHAGFGWGDIGYNFGVDQQGRIWTLRGASIRGAHAMAQANNSKIGILLIVGDNEDLTTDAINAVNRLWKWLQDERYPNIGGSVRGHGQEHGANATACPGPKVRAAISAGRFRPTGATTAPSSSGGSNTPSSSSSSGNNSSSSNNVNGRFLRVTSNGNANVRSSPYSSRGAGNIVGTVASGHLVRRDRSRDTVHFYGVGDRWFLGKSVSRPVAAPASSVLVIGDYPGRSLPVNGSNTFELNMAWRELLARIDIPKGSRVAMIQRWLQGRGYNPGPLDGVEGPLTIRALQRYLNANGHNAGSVDGTRGNLTRQAEKRFLNSQIQYIGSKWPQHYRHTP